MSKTKLGSLLVLALIGIGLLSVFFGSVPLLISEVWAALTGNGQEAHRDIVVNLRLPRILLAGFVGGGLGVAGATFQALLRNPLAEPYILGVSGGASFGAVLILSMGLAATSSWTLPSRSICRCTPSDLSRISCSHLIWWSDGCAGPSAFRCSHSCFFLSLYRFHSLDFSCSYSTECYSMDYGQPSRS